MENFLPHGLLCSNEMLVEEKLRAFREEGPHHLHLLLDYDGTVTHEWDEKGNPRPTLIATLRMGDYLSEEYARAATELANFYRPKEKDPLIPEEVKIGLMQEWWEKHYALLIKHRLNRTDVHKAMNDAKVKIREGMRRILEMSAGAGVPVVIMSANGLGTESIRWHLESQGLLSENIMIVSNDLTWDDKGFLIGFKQPIIHSLNKKETVLAEKPAYQHLRDRKNIILMGDSLHDIGMGNGAEKDRLLGIGFDNSKDGAHLDHYQRTFDVVVREDSEALELVDLVERVIAK